MHAARKDSRNPHFNSRYADMASVVEACRPLFANGICYVQHHEVEGPIVSVTTYLRHSSGQVLVCGTLRAKSRDEGPQSIMSTLTYLRRGSLQCAVGIGSADDDGNAGQDGPAPPAQAAKSARETPTEAAARQSTHDPSWDAGKGRFFATLSSMSIEGADLVRWLAAEGKPRASQMPEMQRETMLSALGTKKVRARYDQWLSAQDSLPTPNEVK
jgi:hypothetical protein